MSSAPTNEFPFIMTTTPDTTEFSFVISAAGKFYIDWGDGKAETIEKANTGEQTISHSYNNAGAHKIKLGGKATEYDSRYTAISFYKNLNLAKIDGSLGQIFSTLSDGTQPQFGSTWNYSGTFENCTNLTGEIPAELFSGISGAPASSMFSGTFSGCSGLTGIVDILGNIINIKAPSAVTVTKQKESKPGAQQTETKKEQNIHSMAKQETIKSVPVPQEQNVQTRKKRRKRHKGSRDVKPQQNSCENLIQGPKFTPVPDMGMTGTISVDIKISGITPDDLAKIIQMACSACNKPNVQITSDSAKHVQQNNLNQR